MVDNNNNDDDDDDDDVGSRVEKSLVSHLSKYFPPQSHITHEVEQIIYHVDVGRSSRRQVGCNRVCLLACRATWIDGGRPS